MARGQMEQHRRSKHASQVSVFSFDYLFLDEKGNVVKRDEGENTNIIVKILVATESRSKCIFAHVVPQKGVNQEHFAVNAAAEQ